MAEPTVATGDPTEHLDHIRQAVKDVAAGSEVQPTALQKEGLTAAMARRLKSLHPIGPKAVSERFAFITARMDVGEGTETLIQAFTEKFRVSRRVAHKYLNRWFFHARQNSIAATRPGAIYDRIWRQLEAMMEKSAKKGTTDDQLKIMKFMVSLAGYGPGAARYRSIRPAGKNNPARAKSASDINKALQEQGTEGMKELMQKFEEQNHPQETAGTPE